jgi:hypothetical protein
MLIGCIETVIEKRDEIKQQSMQMRSYEFIFGCLENMALYVKRENGSVKMVGFCFVIGLSSK